MPTEAIDENEYPLDITNAVARRYRGYWKLLGIPAPDLAKRLHRLRYPGGEALIQRELEQALDGTITPSAALVVMVTDLLIQRNILEKQCTLTWHADTPDKWTTNERLFGYSVTVFRDSHASKWVAAVGHPDDFVKLEFLHGVSDPETHKKNAALYVYLDLEFVELRKIDELIGKP